MLSAATAAPQRALSSRAHGSPAKIAPLRRATLTLSEPLKWERLSRTALVPPNAAICCRR